MPIKPGTIKPGKLGVGAPVKRSKKIRSESLVKDRNIWDDYAPSEKPTEKKGGKKEYEMGAGNRMRPKVDERTAPATPEVLEGEDNNFRPREDYEFLLEQFGIEFSDKTLLARALTHRSALGIKERADYERLEFLGDAVLDLSVAHLLSDRHPEAREGELSKMRAALVNTQALAEIARTLELGPFIKLGRGERSSGGSDRPSILADVMEAVIGAYYRDTNFDKSMEMIESLFGDSLYEVTPFDPKTELQEALHGAGSEPPGYLLELVEGPEHAPTFVTVVQVDGQTAGRGRGTTKKAAQQEAAAHALSRLEYGAEKPELVKGQKVFIEALLLVSEATAATASVSDVGSDQKSESDAA